MIIYITKDNDPEGGHFSFGPQMPDLSHFKDSVAEVRSVDDGDHNLWEAWLLGRLPVGQDGTLDEILAPLWAGGTTVWKEDE